MSYRKDDWHKPRGHGVHLTAAELAIVEAGYLNNRPIPEVARELQCSSRTVSKYYGLMAAEGKPRVRRSSASAPPSRFYKSDFVPS